MKTSRIGFERAARQTLLVLPREVASAHIPGQPIESLDEVASLYQERTGRQASYVVHEVSENAMGALGTVALVRAELGKCFSPYAGNVAAHVALTGGDAHRRMMQCRRLEDPSQPFVLRAMRNDGRACGEIAVATYQILVDYYSTRPELGCQSIEIVRVGDVTKNTDHVFVRVRLVDGTVVIHDHWLHPAAFLEEHGRFSAKVDESSVFRAWQPGMPTEGSFAALLEHSSDAGALRYEELHPSDRAVDSSEASMIEQGRRVLDGQAPLRDEPDCLLSAAQSSELGMTPGEQIAYACADGRFYSPDLLPRAHTVSDEHLRQGRDFIAIYAEQASWEKDLELACHAGDVDRVSVILSQGVVRERFASRHGLASVRGLMMALANGTATPQLVHILVNSAVSDRVRVRLSMAVWADGLARAVRDGRDVIPWLEPAIIDPIKQAFPEDFNATLASVWQSRLAGAGGTSG